MNDFIVTFDLQGNLLICGFLDQFGEVVPIGNRYVVKGCNDIFGLDTSGFSWGSRGHSAEYAGNGFGDAGDEVFTLFGVVGFQYDCVNKCTALYGEFTLELIASEQGFYLYFVPGFNGISVHCDDAIGGTKAGFVGGRFRSYCANQGGCFRMISECDKKAKK